MLNGLRIGNVFIPYYGLLIALAILAAGALGYLLTKRYKLLFDDFILLYAYVGGFAILGAKALYIIVIADQIDWSRITDPAYLNILLSGGFVFLGGLIGAIIALPLVKKIHKIDVVAIIKAVIPCVPLAHALGRIGCHLTGCCYGVEYDGIFHIEYHDNLFAPNDIGLFPIQMTEAIFNLILAFVLLILLLRNGPDIRSIYIYIISYSAARFILEFFRGDVSERGSLFLLSTSQLISIILIIASLLFMFYNIKRKS